MSNSRFSLLGGGPSGTIIFEMITDNCIKHTTLLDVKKGDSRSSSHQRIVRIQGLGYGMQVPELGGC